jgi:hypothetical protein
MLEAAARKTRMTLITAERTKNMATTTTRSAPAPTVAQGLTAEDTKKLLHLIRNSKSIELKLSVPMAQHQPAALRIGLDAVESQPRHVYFFDTADQALNRAGVIVRARRRPGGRADTVVKLRPVDPAMIDAELKRSEAFKVEVDAMPGGIFVCSASYKGVATGQEVLDVAQGRMPLRKLFSKEQLAFYNAHAPAGIDMNSLLAQGPILLLKLKHRPKDYKRGLTAEAWLWKDGKHILELSTKCEPAEAFQVGAEFRAFLAEHGIDLDAKQETKTKTAMQKFKAEHEKRRRARKMGRAARQPAERASRRA